jgi:osmotically-inducible protein OsmY
MMTTRTRSDRDRLQVVPNDREVKSTIVSRLRENPYTQDCRIKVDVHEGVVHLDGRIDSHVAKAVASDDAVVVPGVAEVVNDLVVAA